MIDIDYINRERIKAWIYSGVEIEIELAGLVAENRNLRGFDESDIDIQYNNKQIIILQAKLALVNDMIEKFSKYPLTGGS